MSIELLVYSFPANVLPAYMNALSNQNMSVFPNHILLPVMTTC